MSAIKAYNLRVEEVAGHMPEAVRWELVEGELRIMAPSNPEHSEVAGNLFALIHAHVKKHKLGKAYPAETGFTLRRNPDSLRAPDAAFVRQDRVVSVPRGFFPGSPDLAVEVASPDDTQPEVLDKTAYWLEHGASEVWNVWPKTRTITIHGRGDAVITLGEDDVLDGGSVLPGFACRVVEVFE